MKVQNLKVKVPLFIRIVLTSSSLALILISCSPDGLTETITPTSSSDPMAIGIDVSQSTVVEDIPFEMTSQVLISRPEYPDESILLNVKHKEQDRPKLTNGCLGPFTIGHRWQGWTVEFGRFISTISAGIDPKENLTTCEIELRFPANGTYILLGGSNPFQIEVVDRVSAFVVDIDFIEGTGPFANMNFAGKLYIMDADQIFKCKDTNCYVDIRIVGVLEN